MRKESEFVCFGSKYKTKQFAAVQGMELFKALEDAHPIEILSGSSVLTPEGWAALDNRETINMFVKDLADILAPREVLKVLCAAVAEYSFGFLAGWNSVRVPSRFQSGMDAVESKGMDPVIANLFSNGVSVQSLEEYYSLEDAFGMFDALVAKSVNTALSSEASARDAANRR